MELRARSGFSEVRLYEPIFPRPATDPATTRLRSLQNTNRTELRFHAQLGQKGDRTLQVGVV
jgi:hypothetical protein